MSGEMMNFPDTAEEFMEQNKIVDTEHVYSNGMELVPIFRMRQWFEHVQAADVAPVVRGRWVETVGWVTLGGDPVWECSECGKGMHVYGIEHGTYGFDVADGQWVACPNCGADMRGWADE